MNIDKRIEEIENLLFQNPPYAEFVKLANELRALEIKLDVKQVSGRKRIKCSDHYESLRFAI